MLLVALVLSDQEVLVLKEAQETMAAVAHLAKQIEADPNQNVQRQAILLRRLYARARSDVEV